MPNEMRDRLIELIVNADTYDSYECKLCTKEDTSCTCCGVEKLADHLIANGVIVPPCKVGDKVYAIENPYTFLPFKKALEGNVMSIHQHEHGLFIRVLFDTKKINGCVDYSLDWKLNKTVFLTKEEAEAKLKESESK